jgi:REP element-mobilizing transposase RayT
VSEHIHRSHNVSALLYHLVCPAKYRRAVCSDEVDKALRDVCLEIAARYEIRLLEIGTDRDHVHFLVQSVPAYSPTKVARVIKSLTAARSFAECPRSRNTSGAASSGRTGTPSAPWGATQ